MRTNTINNIEITYPDETIWLKDNIFIKLKSLTGMPVGARVQVTDLASGMYRKLVYYSELDEIVFSLNDTFMSLWNDAFSFNVSLMVYENGVHSTDFGFDTDAMNGKTLPLRRHGSARTIYVYDDDDLWKVGLILPASGDLSLNGCHFPVVAGGFKQFDFRRCVTQAGDYSICYNSSEKGGDNTESEIKIVNVGNITPLSGVAQLYFADTSGVVPSGDKGGGVWTKDDFYLESYCIKLVYDNVCDNFDFFKVRYTDTDGITRFLGGKVIEDTTNSNGENFYYMDTTTVIRNISRRHIREANGTVKVGYSNLRRDSYWQDILLSDKVEFLNYNGDWVECSVSTSKATIKSDETQDVELEYELYNM